MTTKLITVKEKKTLVAKLHLHTYNGQLLDRHYKMNKNSRNLQNFCAIY
jgi:hypothetical protein